MKKWVTKSKSNREKAKENGSGEIGMWKRETKKESADQNALAK